MSTGGASLHDEELQEDVSDPDSLRGDLACATCLYGASIALRPPTFVPSSWEGATRDRQVGTVRAALGDAAFAAAWAAGEAMTLEEAIATALEHTASN
jgi:hypothetical protein